MKDYIPNLILLIVICALGMFFGIFAREAFQSGGTIVQLQTSHVPTPDELREEHRWLRKRIEQDMLDLTGSA
jgi:hypothetical protein